MSHLNKIPVFLLLHVSHKPQRFFGVVVSVSWIRLWPGKTSTSGPPSLIGPTPLSNLVKTKLDCSNSSAHIIKPCVGFLQKCSYHDVPEFRIIVFVKKIDKNGIQVRKHALKIRPMNEQWKK